MCTPTADLTYLERVLLDVTKNVNMYTTTANVTKNMYLATGGVTKNMYLATDSALRSVYYSTI